VPLAAAVLLLPAALTADVPWLWVSLGGLCLLQAVVLVVDGRKP